MRAGARMDWETAECRGCGETRRTIVMHTYTTPARVTRLCDECIGIFTLTIQLRDNNEEFLRDLELVATAGPATRGSSIGDRSSMEHGSRPESPSRVPFVASCTRGS